MSGTARRVHRRPRRHRRPSFFHHLHPPSIPAAQARFRYNLGAGGLSVLLVLVTVATGALELFFYVPTPEEAALSIQKLHYLVPYGSLVRNLHFWSAQALVVVASLHLLRVIFTGSYAAPRRFNYLLGLGMLVLILLLDFTGYILRWDESVRWALVAGTNLLGSIPVAGPALYRLAVGSSQPGEVTLLRFYAWHVFGLTLGLIGLVSWHIFRVRRDGGIAAPPANPLPEQALQPAGVGEAGGPSAAGGQPAAGRITRFELVRREGTTALVAFAILIVMAVFLPVPIGAPITGAGMTGSDSRAPWFFLWVQQLIKWGDPFWMGVLAPLAMLALLAAFPYLLPTPRQDELGRWLPRRARLAQVLTGLIFLLLIALTTISVLETPPPAGLAPGFPAPTPSASSPALQEPGLDDNPRGPAGAP